MQEANVEKAFQSCLIDDCEELTYLSQDGETEIAAFVWRPGVPKGRTPRGIVQFVHGFSEHSLRYGNLVEFLTSLGLIVCSNDHLGHGLTGEHAQGYGQFVIPNASEVFIEDAWHLHDLLYENLDKEMPYFLIGCSSGTFIARNIAAKHSNEIDGLVLAGVSHIPASAARPLLKLSTAKMSIAGPRSKCGFANFCMLGQFDQSLQNQRDNFGWRCTDSAVVGAYRNDVRCGFQLSSAGCKAFYESVIAADDADSINAMRKDLPVLFLSGANDPVGDHGIGEIAVVNQFTGSGMTKVSILSYADMLHDIFHEPNRQDVFDDLRMWLEECTACEL